MRDTTQLSPKQQSQEANKGSNPKPRPKMITDSYFIMAIREPKYPPPQPPSADKRQKTKPFKKARPAGDRLSDPYTCTEKV